MRGIVDPQTKTGTEIKLLHGRTPEHHSPHHPLNQACSIQCVSDEARPKENLSVNRPSGVQVNPPRKNLTSESGSRQLNETKTGKLSSLTGTRELGHKVVCSKCYDAREMKPLSTLHQGRKRLHFASIVT